MKLNEKRILKKDFLKFIKENEFKEIEILYKNIIGLNKPIILKDIENNNYYLDMSYKEYLKYKHLLKIEN